MRIRDIFYLKTGQLRCGWRALLFAAIYLPLSILLFKIIAGLFFTQEQLNKYPLLESVILGLAAIPAYLGTGGWIAARYEHLTPRTLGLSLDESWLSRVGGGFLGGIAVVLLFLGTLRAAGIATFTGHAPAAHEWVMIGFAALCLLVDAAATVIIAQGYIFQTLLRGMGIPLALLCSVLCYLAYLMLGDAAKYISHPFLGVTIAISILTLGMLYLRSGSLWLPIGLYAGWNFGLALFSLPLGDPTPIYPAPFTATLHGYPLLVGGKIGPESGAFAALAQLVLFAVATLAPYGRALASRWWEWRELQVAPSVPVAWDFTIGRRQYQWRFLLPEDSE